MADQFHVSLGYNNQEVFADPVRAASADVERGLYLNYTVQLGAAYYSMSVFPQGGFSLGAMGINLQTGVERKPFQQADVILEMGSTTGENGFYQRYLWSGPFENSSPFSLEFHYQFWSLTSGKLLSYPQQKGHFQQFSLGAQYSPIAVNDKFQLLPYISLKTGYRDERLYPGTEPGDREMLGSINAIAEGGLRVKLPGNFIPGNCQYGFSLFYSYAATLFTLQEVPESADFNFAADYGAFGVGLFVMANL